MKLDVGVVTRHAEDCGGHRHKLDGNGGSGLKDELAVLNAYGVAGCLPRLSILAREGCERRRGRLLRCLSSRVGQEQRERKKYEVDGRAKNEAANQMSTLQGLKHACGTGPVAALWRRTNR